jgi:hypothetical protein
MPLGRVVHNAPNLHTTARPDSQAAHSQRPSRHSGAAAGTRVLIDRISCWHIHSMHACVTCGHAASCCVTSSCTLQAADRHGIHPSETSQSLLKQASKLCLHPCGIAPREPSQLSKEHHHQTSKAPSSASILSSLPESCSAPGQACPIRLAAPSSGYAVSCTIRIQHSLKQLATSSSLLCSTGNVHFPNAKLQLALNGRLLAFAGPAAA